MFRITSEEPKVAELKVLPGFVSTTLLPINADKTGAFEKVFTPPIAWSLVFRITSEEPKVAEVKVLPEFVSTTLLAVKPVKTGALAKVFTPETV